MNLALRPFEGFVLGRPKCVLVWMIPELDFRGGFGGGNGFRGARFRELHFQRPPRCGTDFDSYPVRTLSGYSEGVGPRSR